MKKAEQLKCFKSVAFAKLSGLMRVACHYTSCFSQVFSGLSRIAATTALCTAELLKLTSASESEEVVVHTALVYAYCW